MNNLYLLIPTDFWTQPDSRRPYARELLTAFEALWHPSLLANAETAPSWRDVQDLPTGECLLAVPQVVLDAAGQIIRLDVQERGASVLVAKPEHQSPSDLLSALNLTAGDPVLLEDFYTLGFAFFGLELMIRTMGHQNTLDHWALLSEAKEAAKAYLRDDFDETRRYLQAAFDLLLAARQYVYPATISAVDLALYHPDVSEDAAYRRFSRQAPINLILAARELEEMAAKDPSLVERLRLAVSTGNLEALAGSVDDRPFTLLPVESRFWQLIQSAKIFEEHLGRVPEGFGSRTAALIADLPQLLMKIGFRHALHAAFDGSKYPKFKEPKLHWTSADGSVVEALSRTAIDAGDEASGLGFFAHLGKTTMQDRAATIALAHWFPDGADWYRRLIAVSDYSEIFGKFVPLGEYFHNSYYADHPTQTFIEEYASNALSAAAARGDANPISRWRDHYHMRGRLDAALSLAGLAQIATGETETDWAEVENSVERGHNDAAQRLENLHSRAGQRLADMILTDAPHGRGYLIVNPCSFPRRLCIEIDGPFGAPSLQVPVRAVDSQADRPAIVVDVPGWGFAWLPAGDSAKPEKTAPLASGKRIRNEYLEVEVDSKTGGVRGVWQARTGYSQIAQQLVCTRPGSRPVCESVEVRRGGPAFGEIVSKGSLRDQNGADLARFEQSIRLWIGKPMVEISILLTPNAPALGKDPKEYIGCRWAWPDEKSSFSPASGLCIQQSSAVDVESLELIELRERHLVTDLLLHGSPFHRRISPRMADTILWAPGETRYEHRLTIAVNLAHPIAAAWDHSWPVWVRPVEKGPPAQGKTGWLARVDVSNLLCTRLTPGKDNSAVFRIAETDGKSTHAELRFAKAPTSARLTNALGDLIYDLHPHPTGVSLDLAASELIQLEVCF